VFDVGSQRSTSHLGKVDFIRRMHDFRLPNRL
jgi:hypothetical protein